jgi:hypothetical protein
VFADEPGVALCSGLTAAAELPSVALLLTATVDQVIASTVPSPSLLPVESASVPLLSTSVPAAEAQSDASAEAAPLSIQSLATPTSTSVLVATSPGPVSFFASSLPLPFRQRNVKTNARSKLASYVLTSNEHIADVEIKDAKKSKIMTSKSSKVKKIQTAKTSGAEKIDSAKTSRTNKIKSE